MTDINTIIENIIVVEGGYVNHPNDKGGPTCWGITEKVARKYGYKGDMKDLPKDTAKQIYIAQYFLEPKFNKIEALSPTIAAELTDTGINCGTVFAKPLIQRCLNLLNRNQKDYVDIIVDGKIGPDTLSALKAFLTNRGKQGEQVLLKMLNVIQGQKYIEICEKNQTQEDFIFGWFANRVEI